MTIPRVGDMKPKTALLTAGVLIAAAPAMAFAQDAPVPKAQPDDQAPPTTDAPDDTPPDSIVPDDNAGDIVVVGTRLRGAVVTDYEPVLELDPQDIASYGASSVADLLDALAPQTGSGRGRGSGRPVVLINGQPVSGFRELRNIPPEAIQRVQVLPEEVALQYGYRPDQRVINFILVDNFSSINAELGQGLSTAGGYGTSELEATYTKFTEDSRLNLNIEYEPTTKLTESERAIVQPSLAANESLVGDIGPQDVGAYRTLLPSTHPLQANAVYSGSFSKAVQFSLNAAYAHNETQSLFGLNNAALVVSASNPFARTGADETIRFFTVQPRPLTRDVTSNSYQGGFSVNALVSGWRASLTGDIDDTIVSTRTDQRADFAAVAAGLAASDPANAINPFAGPELGALLPPLVRDSARSDTLAGNLLGSLSGSPVTLPAGEATATLSAGYSYLSLDSENSRFAGSAQTSLSRSQGNIAANIDLPVFGRDFGIGKALGDVSVNGNLGYRELSDFGGLVEYGYGLTWKPFGNLSFSASSINADSAPALTQLGNPVIVTPNVPIFDFTTGQTVLAALTTGGNPDLVQERQRDIKLAVNYEPKFLDGLEFLGEYTRNRSFDNSTAFPLLTPEIEAAFPGRVVRDANGQLVALDQRPVTFNRVNSEKFRYGFRFSKSFGRGSDDGDGEPGGGNRGAGRNRGQPEAQRGNNAGQTSRPESQPGREQPQAAEAKDSPRQSGAAEQSDAPANRENSARSGAGGERGAGRGGGRGGFGGRRGGRWEVFAYHTIEIDETILIRPGVPELDLLNGSAIGDSGGVPRHKVEFGGGWFNNGIGVRFNGNYRSATRVNGSGLPGSSDLFFGDIATADVRVFFNFDSREKLVQALPLLKGSRVSLRLDNIFGGIQAVRDENDLVPLRYQPGFVDPRGRFFEVSFRKTF